MRGIEALSVSHTVKFPRGRKRRRWPAHPSAYLNSPTTSSHGFLPHASLGFQTFPNTILLKSRAPKREAPDLYKRLSECGNLTNTEPTCRALRKQRRQNSPAAGGGARGSPDRQSRGREADPEAGSTHGGGRAKGTVRRPPRNSSPSLLAEAPSLQAEPKSGGTKSEHDRVWF